MAELTRLLGFMSSWDRQAALKKYDALFDAAEDPEALIEKLGTPTRLAIELARAYVPTVAPEPGTGETAEKEEAIPEQLVIELAPERETLPPEPAVRKTTKTGALIAYLIPAVLVGLPVALVLVCIGLPILAAGAALIAFAVKEGLAFVAMLSLASDILLAAGAALVLCALGLVLCWLGLWLSITLCRAWIGGAVVPLGRRLCVKKEAV